MNVAEHDRVLQDANPAYAGWSPQLRALATKSVKELYYPLVLAVPEISENLYHIEDLINDLPLELIRDPEQTAPSSSDFKLLNRGLESLPETLQEKLRAGLKHGLFLPEALEIAACIPNCKDARRVAAWLVVLFNVV